VLYSLRIGSFPPPQQQQQPQLDPRGAGYEANAWLPDVVLSMLNWSAAAARQLAPALSQLAKARSESKPLNVTLLQPYPQQNVITLRVNSGTLRVDSEGRSPTRLRFADGTVAFVQELRSCIRGAEPRRLRSVAAGCVCTARIASAAVVVKAAFPQSLEAGRRIRLQAEWPSSLNAVPVDGRPVFPPIAIIVDVVQHAGVTVDFSLRSYGDGYRGSLFTCHGDGLRVRVWPLDATNAHVSMPVPRCQTFLLFCQPTAAVDLSDVHDALLVGSGIVHVTIRQVWQRGESVHEALAALATSRRTPPAAAADAADARYAMRIGTAAVCASFRPSQGSSLSAMGTAIRSDEALVKLAAAAALGELLAEVPETTIRLHLSLAEQESLFPRPPLLFGSCSRGVYGCDGDDVPRVWRNQRSFVARCRGVSLPTTTHDDNTAYYMGVSRISARFGRWKAQREPLTLLSLMAHAAPRGDELDACLWFAARMRCGDSFAMEALDGAKRTLRQQVDVPQRSRTISDVFAAVLAASLSLTPAAVRGCTGALAMSREERPCRRASLPTPEHVVRLVEAAGPDGAPTQCAAIVYRFVHYAVVLANRLSPADENRRLVHEILRALHKYQLPLLAVPLLQLNERAAVLDCARREAPSSRLAGAERMARMSGCAWPRWFILAMARLRTCGQPRQLLSPLPPASALASEVGLRVPEWRSCVDPAQGFADVDGLRVAVVPWRAVEVAERAAAARLLFRDRPCGYNVLALIGQF
jgi:hypothetical protein